MRAEQRQMVFYGALAAAVILAIIAITYLTKTNPTVSSDRVHYKHAILFFVLAAGALVVANFNRPGMRPRI